MRRNPWMNKTKHQPQHGRFDFQWIGLRKILRKTQVLPSKPMLLMGGSTFNYRNHVETLKFKFPTMALPQNGCFWYQKILQRPRCSHSPGCQGSSPQPLLSCHRLWWLEVSFPRPGQAKVRIQRSFRCRYGHVYVYIYIYIVSFYLCV